jgi:hypothetical protein
MYSTLTFLNRDVFSHLQKLRSLENDRQWQSLIENSTDDERLEMIAVEGSMADAASRDLLQGCQLVLIDDSRSADDRSATIRAVVSQLPEDALLLIHDFEVVQYQQAADHLPYRFVFDALLPMTAVLSSQPLGRVRTYRKANRTIRRFAHCTPLDAIDEWLAVLKS